MVYQKISIHPVFAPMSGLKTLLLVFSMCMAVPLTASAEVVAGLFEVEMPVLDESKKIRDAALDDGLIEVLIRISGDSRILEKIQAPAGYSYVKRYEYLTRAPAEVGGLPSRQLWVSYNTTRVLQFLREKAIPIWGEHRSRAVVWLAVRDGNQRYILKNDDVSLIKSKSDAAFSRRGIPVIWPQNDALDQQSVRFADVWAGFAEPLKQASRRYSSGPVIVANLDWNGVEWKAEWSLLMADEVSKWSLKGLDYAELIATVTDLMADVMGKKYAVLETLDVSQHEMMAIEIDQVKDVATFRRVEKYLSSLSAVQAAQLSRIEPERVFFDLTLRSKVDDFLTMVQSGSILRLLVAEAVISPPAPQAGLKEGPVMVNASENISATGTDSGAVLNQTKSVSYRFSLR